MYCGTTQEITPQDSGVLCLTGNKRISSPACRLLYSGCLAILAYSCGYRLSGYHCLSRMEAYAGYGKMVERGRSGL